METRQNQAGTKIDQGLQVFNTVQNRLNQLNVSNELNGILKSQINHPTGKVKLSSKEFEVLGGISYLFGLDFYGLTKWNSETMTNVLMRLLVNKITESQIDDYFKVLKNLVSIEPVSDARVKLMDLIKSPIIYKNLTDGPKLIDSIRLVINKSLVPVELAQDLNQRFYEKDFLTYHDLIVFNSFAYNDSIFGGKSAAAFIEVSNLSSYNTSLVVASDYFELQKFALFYEESILNFYSKNIENENELFSKKFFKEFLTEENQEAANQEDQQEKNQFIQTLLINVQDYFEKQIQPSLNEEKPSLEVVHNSNESIVSPLSDGVHTLEEANENPLQNPTNVINHILVDFNKIRQAEGLTTFAFKEDPKELLLSLESMLEVEDLISSFYTFLSKYSEFKRTPEVEVVQIDTDKLFNYSLEEMNTAFNNYIKEYQDKYTKIISEYVLEIPEDKLKDVVERIGNLLGTLYIGNAEDKGIILSQLNENTVFTVKHLHQMINTIEGQYIKGEYFNIYVDFKNHFEKTYGDILELFDESQKLEGYELRIKLAHTFLSAFN